MSTQSFIQQYLSDAQVAAQQLGFPVSVVLAQWINETGSGTSQAFNQANNYAGVSNHGMIDQYPDKRAGLAAYIVRWSDPVYSSTRAAIASNGGRSGNPYVAAKAVEQSPWAAGHYGGSGLEALIQQQNLQQYDTGNTNYPVPPDLAAAEKADRAGGGAGTAAAGGDNSNDCIWHLPSISLGPISGGGGCILNHSQGRALLGAVSLLGGVALVVVGLAFLGLRSKAGQTIVNVVPSAAKGAT
jgi:hypothetical protein